MKVGQDEAHSSDEQEDVEADLFTFVEEENRWEFLGTRSEEHTSDSSHT